MTNKLNSRSQKSKDDLLEIASLRGVKVLEEYVNNSTKLFMKCAVGHRFQSSPASFKAGTGCPRCFANKKREIRKNHSRVTPLTR